MESSTKAYASGMQKIERIRVEIVAVVRLNRNALTISGRAQRFCEIYRLRY